jgi:hypothetical protein
VPAGSERKRRFGADRAVKEVTPVARALGRTGQLIRRTRESPAAEEDPRSCREQSGPRWSVRDAAVKRPEVTMTMTALEVDQLGPVDWIVVEFPGSDFGKGQVAPILQDYVDRGLVRVLDMLFLKKDDSGAVEPYEIADLGDGELGDFRAFETGLAMLLSEQDVVDLAETMDPGTSAVLLVWENVWAAPFGSAVRHAGGELVASGRIPTQAILAAADTDTDTEEGA